MKSKQYLIAFTILLTIFAGCKKEKDPVTPIQPGAKTSTLQLQFQNVVNGLNLELNTVTYQNNEGEDFTISTYKYYISNIILHAEDNSTFTESESYHLINSGADTALVVSLKKVPVKKYKSISFLIGVDSTRNVSGAQSGALDPANDMFWTWNTGYIMAKLEGSSAAAGGNIFFHIGGFSGPQSVLKNITLNFPEAANVSTSVTPRVVIESDAAEWFKTPNTISFATIGNVLGDGAEAKMIADNYADMFTVIEVQN